MDLNCSAIERGMPSATCAWPVEPEAASVRARAASGSYRRWAFACACATRKPSRCASRRARRASARSRAWRSRRAIFCAAVSGGGGRRCAASSAPTLRRASSTGIATRRARSCARCSRSAASMASASAWARAASASGEASPVPGGSGLAPGSSSSRMDRMRSTRCCRSRACVASTRAATLRASAAATRLSWRVPSPARFRSSNANSACTATEPVKYGRAATKRRSRCSRRSLRRMPGTRMPAISGEDRVGFNDRRLFRRHARRGMQRRESILSRRRVGRRGGVRYRTPASVLSAGRPARARSSTGRRTPARCRPARRAPGARRSARAPSGPRR